MREDVRKDMYKLEGSIRIVHGECEKCPDKNSDRCTRYECPKWDRGWVIEKVSYGGSIDVVRTGLLFSEVKDAYKEILEEIRKETDDKLRGGHRK